MIRTELVLPVTIVSIINQNAQGDADKINHTAPEYWTPAPVIAVDCEADGTTSGPCLEGRQNGDRTASNDCQR
ncbi:hypothetical protein RRG08_051036 [Elysia crispata]|uniref:Uncharacterized protein n=1 Tax=Elysia crispata TaxID=231223 RepID=A0AAE1DB15_9GAST|nr:hypothetical protein RRG08_051036 [Elysia crispata]